MDAVVRRLSIILRRPVRLALAWIAAIVATTVHGYVAWHSYDTAHLANDPAQARIDGNFGHTLIDFAGQWLMARMLVTGQGHQLYQRPVEREVLTAAYPRTDEAPQAKVSDVDNLMGWMMEVPDSIGGPLYPPTQAFIFSPLGLMTPRVAYRFAQMGVLAAIWLSAALLSLLSDRRIWWPVIVLLLLGYPGFQGTLHLAQNSAFSLMVVAAGWLLAARGQNLMGGLVWSLLAFKPTWATAFLLVPVLTRRWRMLAGMVFGGAALIVVTLPLVGIEAWRHWYDIGRAAAELYTRDENWVLLSRDLLNVPRRWLLDFHLPLDERDRPVAVYAGWGLWGLVFVLTVIVSLVRPARSSIGVRAAFAGLGAWLSCFHFIYYDSLLSAWAVFLLLTHARFEWPTFNLRPFVFAALAFLIVYELAFAWLAIDATITVGGLARDSASPPGIHLTTRQHGTPWDTFAILLLWGYCGVRTVAGAKEHNADQT